MDATDIAILRELARGRVFFWASLDPRVRAERVARTPRRSPTTVRSRLRAWQRSGFLARIEVIPHPALLGLRIGAGSVRVDDPRDEALVIESIGLVPGALGVLDHVGPWLALSVLAESQAGLDRVRRLVARLPGVDEAAPCPALSPPPPTRCRLTRLDWRILAALRAAPVRPLRESAADVGVTPKTFSRRYGALLDSSAALFVPVLDFSRCGNGTMARFLVTPRDGAERGPLLARMRRLPRLVDAFDAGPITGAPAARVDPWLHLPTAVEAEDVAREVLGMPGVAAVEPTFPVRQAFFTGWLDDAVRARAGEPVPRPAGGFP